MLLRGHHFCSKASTDFFNMSAALARMRAVACRCSTATGGKMKWPAEIGGIVGGMASGLSRPSPVGGVAHRHSKAATPGRAKSNALRREMGLAWPAYRALGNRNSGEPINVSWQQLAQAPALWHGVVGGRLANAARAVAARARLPMTRGEIIIGITLPA